MAVILKQPLFLKYMIFQKKFEEFFFHTTTYRDNCDAMDRYNGF